MISGPRQGDLLGIRRYFAQAMSKDLNVFVIPGLDVARAYGLDIEAANLTVVASPRHAGVLLIIGDVSPEIREAASIIYAQMLRPKAVLAIGLSSATPADLLPLPMPDISVTLSQTALNKGVIELRALFKNGSFQKIVDDYDAPALHIRIEYVCPMHPEVVQDEPGSCPKCGMFLVEREVQATTQETTALDQTVQKEVLETPPAHNHDSDDSSDNNSQPDKNHSSNLEYICPMHEDVVQDEPGQCPKCGMFLEPRKKTDTVKTEPKPVHEHHEATLEYICPMHADVVQDEPGQCPKCGMFLEPREKTDTVKTESQSTHDHHEATLEYICPMHEDVIQDEPGKCPKCGMFLEPHEKTDAVKTESQSTHDHHEATMQYICPMHEEVVQDEPGKCPKCGMFLEPREKTDAVKTEPKPVHEHHEATLEYICPMHEDVIQDEPGKCPKCGMFLEPREKQSTSHSDHGNNHNEANKNSHDQMNHEESGFMSMIDVTKDLPRSSDDLQMEWIDAPFGPFFPGLPSGLSLIFSLDGDTIAGAKSQSTTQNIPLLEHIPMHGGCFVKRFLAMHPLAPVTSKILMCQAIENLADITIDKYEKNARIGALERERLTSHLNWLVLFAQQTGFAWLEKKASILQLQIFNADVSTISSLEPTVKKFVNRIRKTPLLKPRTSNIGYIESSHHLCGVIARAAGIDKDERNNDESYRSLGFKSILQTESDAWARLHIRLDEILQSIKLIQTAGEISIPNIIDLENMSGTGKAILESPRGEISLTISMEKGAVTAVDFLTPSTQHLSLIESITNQQELGDALIAVGSLDLCPWEIHS